MCIQKYFFRAHYVLGIMTEADNPKVNHTLLVPLPGIDSLGKSL